MSRFIDIFINPLLKEEYTQAEMNNVDSEYRNYADLDGMIVNSLINSLAKEGHPLKKNNVGNIQTLQKVTPEIVRNFMNKQYSSNNAVASFLSLLTLNEMEKTLIPLFSQLIVKKNKKNKPLQYNKLLKNRF